jgi:prolipoprotein diacylglyceryltransferase
MNMSVAKPIALSLSGFHIERFPFSFKVGFLVGICLPCYEMLKDLLPHTADLLDGARYISLLKE